MQLETLSRLSQEGTPDDVADYLRAYGTRSTEDPSTHKKTGAVIDWIIDGVLHDKDDARRQQKQALIADHAAGTGVFAKEQDLPVSVADEIRQTIQDLTQRVEKMEAAQRADVEEAGAPETSVTETPVAEKPVGEKKGENPVVSDFLRRIGKNGR